MFPRIPFLGKIKIPRAFFAFALLFLTFCIFYLDWVTGEEIAFYVFYVPSIMLMAWSFGKKSGWLMVALVTLMWTLAQWRIAETNGMFVLVWNVAIRTATFMAICWMTLVIRDREKRLEEQSMELARSNLELELFAGKAAHDLQSPLATILGFAELLKEKYQDPGHEEAKEFAERIIKSVKRMSVFIKALLSYARVRKHEPVAASPVELEKIVREVIGDFYFLIHQKKAEVTCGSLPVLSIDPGLAGLLFQNLIGNAIKYCEKEPRIRVSAVHEGKEWIFSVRDNGIGIPEESRESVFIMFEKLPTKRQYPGSGIGLATCQKIVERYGGRIWVESQPGEGSTFFFTLPAPHAAGDGQR
ncbi:MAG: ATP-binding protein [Candidatus Omnitrophica bacterium]|nr:ATP-binding protein [Candidatus Omnitrophota bacterium]